MRHPPDPTGESMRYPSSAAVRALTVPSNWSEFGQTPQFRQGPDSSRRGYYSVRSVAQPGIVRAAGADLIRRRARAGVRTVRLVQLDMPARQYPRRHDDSADTGKGRADTGQLQSELVHSPAIAWARIGVVLRSGPELDRAEKVGVGRAADIAHVQARGRLEVCVNAVAAHVQAGVFSGLVVVHEVHMAEEPVMLASSDQAAVRVIAVVRDDKPAAGGEVARKWNDMGFRYPSAGENHHRSRETRDEKCQHPPGDRCALLAHDLIPSN